MQLRNLDGSGYLSGRWVNVRTNTGAAAYSTSNTFIFSREEHAEVIVHEYGHAVHAAQVPGFGTSLDARLDR